MVNIFGQSWQVYTNWTCWKNYSSCISNFFLLLFCAVKKILEGIPKKYFEGGSFFFFLFFCGQNFFKGEDLKNFLERVQHFFLFFGTIFLKRGPNKYFEGVKKMGGGVKSIFLNFFLGGGLGGGGTMRGVELILWPEGQWEA